MSGEPRDGLSLFPLIALVVASMAMACENAPPAPAGLSPTSPSVMSAGLGEDAAATISSGADLARCLGPSRDARCFSVGRWQTSAVASDAVTAAPINLSAAVNATTVTLAWTAPTFQDAPVISYVIDVGSLPGFVAADLANIDTGTAAATLTAPGVPPGTYYVRVRARNALGLSAPSNEIQVVVALGGVLCPGAPRLFNAVLSSTGVVTMSWLPPVTGGVGSYLLQAGSASGLSNIASFSTGNAALVFVANNVAPGAYYLRVRSEAGGCAPSAASNEVLVTVPAPSPPPGPPVGNPQITLTLSYTCSPCTGDLDNYALNVDCVAGRCQIFRTPNAFRSPNTITTSLRMAPGLHNVEVVVRNAGSPWTLTLSGGVVANSIVRLDQEGGALTLGTCRASSVRPEVWLGFTVASGAAC